MDETYVCLPPTKQNVADHLDRFPPYLSLMKNGFLRHPPYVKTGFQPRHSQKFRVCTSPHQQPAVQSWDFFGGLSRKSMWRALIAACVLCAEVTCVWRPFDDVLFRCFIMWAFSDYIYIALYWLSSGKEEKLGVSPVGRRALFLSFPSVTNYDEHMNDYYLLPLSLHKLG